MSVMRPGRKLRQARELRRDATHAERLLWEQLRDRRLSGLKFNRQHPVPPDVCDFVCRELKLVVEVDGATHSTPEEIAKDRARGRFLFEQGYGVIRFQNEEIEKGMDEVVALIAQRARSGT